MQIITMVVVGLSLSKADESGKSLALTAERALPSHLKPEKKWHTF